MKSKLNQRWMIAVAIWLAAIFMSYWNFSKIEAISTIRDNSEQLLKEYGFQHRNADKLLHVQNLYRSYYKPVASLKLGFESVRSPLHALAAVFGLENVKFESQISRATHDQVPFTMRMTGNHHKALGFASALLKYPYISMDRSRIKVLNNAGKAEIEVELAFQFIIIPPKSMSPSSLQASALQKTQEVMHQ